MTENVAVERCPECNTPVPPDATICPTCGGRIDYAGVVRDNMPFFMLTALGAGIFLLLFVLLLIH